MATTSPNSYLDPYWSDLAARAAKRNDVPPDLLVSILTKGERSNADQVSEADARTPFQVTKKTRDLVLKRDGVDAFLSDDNAADVAAKVLKDGLNFAKKRAETPEEQNALAAGFYHAGGDFKDWGPRTRSYVQRVTGGLPSPPESPTGQPQQTATAPSQQSIIARAYDAYRAGRMSPADAAEFEADVNAGTVNLPLGASLIRRAETAAATGSVPQSVIDAYKSGRMTPQDAAEFEADMRANPSLVPEGLTIKPFRAEIPGQTEGAPSDVSRAVPEPTIGEQVIGAGETALALGTGAIGGPVGAVRGFVGGLADPSVTSIRQLEQATQQGAESLTYAPRTAAGQAQTQAVGQAAQNLIPIAPLAPQIAGLQRAGQAARPTAQVLQQTVPQVARDTAATAAQNVAAGARAIPERVGQALGRQPAAPTPGTMGSVGSAAVDIATQRRMAANELPIPLGEKMTKGMATRDFAQQQFEKETAKHPTAGAPLRERVDELNEGILRNMDMFFDETGATSPELRATGVAVDKALVDQAKRDRTEINVKYAKANRSEEAKAPVDHALEVTLGEGDDAITSTPFAYINEQPTGLPSSAVPDAARQYAVRLGIADIVDGQLVAKPATIAQMEAWRKAINGATGREPADIRNATILKRLIDGQTEPVAGPLYRDARNTRARYAQNYEDRATIAKLLNEKRGTSDRQVALEDVFKHTILDGSLDDVRNVQRVLMRSGPDGIQAWKELQGQTVNHLRTIATRSNATDQTGNKVISAAALEKEIAKLDADGRLDRIFGKKGAEQIRTLSEVTNAIRTAPPGSVNTSNTASILAATLDLMLSASTGAPAPLASSIRFISKEIRERKLKARIEEALGRQAAANSRPRAKVKPIDIKKP